MDRSNAQGLSRALVLTALVCFGCTIGVEDPFWAGGPTPGGGALPDPATTGMDGGDTSGVDGDGAGSDPDSVESGNATAVPDGDDGPVDDGTSGAVPGDGDGDGDGDPGTSTAASAGGSSDDGSMGSSSVGGESDDDGNAAGVCAPAAVENLIGSSFADCGDDARIGQVDFAAGVTCSQVCCMFGFDSCVHQAGQNNPFFCTPEGAPLIGGCDDVFPNNWMYQCLCA